MAASGNFPYPGRIALVIAFVTLWGLLILGRLVQLQILRHDEFAQLALERQQITRPAFAPRGIIYDNRMNELATSVTVNAVVAEPRRIKNPGSAARSLASILGLDGRKLLARLNDPAKRSYCVVQHRVDPKDAADIEALDIDGIYLEEESMRVYPNRELACHVLGFVNMEGAGGAGIELLHDRVLRGRDGEISYSVDARRRSFRGVIQKSPVQGHSLVLSLDKSIQFVAERELRAEVERTRAASGTAIVMEPDTGRILAFANYPNFNSNLYNQAPPSLWRNRAVSDLFEPGSTFKVVVAATALEAGLTWPDEPINCQMGSIVIGRHTFHDHKPYGILTFNQVLEQSSNVGAAKLGLRLGERRLHAALLSFGFGMKTGIDLPGEIVGLVRDYKEWSALSIGAVSFGQEVGVTSLQMLRAINAIANSGFLVTPTVVDREIDEEGNLIRVATPARTRVISARTAAAVREAFEGVVMRGTGRRGAMEGYRSAGKTGTAQKIVNGRYSDTKYLASFIGFAPLPEPRLTVLVQIDEPKGKIYGGDVAAPVFANIVRESLIQLRVPPDKSVPKPAVNPRLASASRDYFPNATPVAPIQVAAEAQAEADGGRDIVIAAGPDSLVMPDFQGLAKREVMRRCQALGIRLQMKGAGAAVGQDPAAGAFIARGDTCSVAFARSVADQPAWNAETYAAPSAAGLLPATQAPARRR